MVDRIAPLYNMIACTKEAKFGLEVAHIRAKQLLVINKINQKNNYDRNILDCNFRIGDLLVVFLKNEPGQKLYNQYKCPYKINRLDLSNNVIIEDKITNKEQIVHKNRLKLYN